MTGITTNDEGFGLTQRLPSSYLWTAAALFAFYVISPFYFNRGVKLPGAPIVGAKSIFEPSFFTRYRFVVQAWAIVLEGHRKFKDRAFTILRPDSTITVLPKRYVDELQSLPDTKVDGIQAIVDDLMGKYTGIEILLNSHLAPTAIRSKLTPQLATLIPMIEEEMRQAFEVEYPSSKETWTEIDLQKRALGVVSRVTARLFVGFPLCRNEKWLELNSQIVEQLFITVMVMRNFPPWVHPVLNKILPSQYKLKKILRQIHSMLLPIIEERRRNPPPSEEKPIDVLEYMMDLAKGTEAEAQNLAMRYCYTIIGSVHTVTGAIIDSVYEVCARPEYAEPLRHEIQQALDEEGGWNKTTLSKLRKVDSFMKEVQRMYPPSAIGFRRMVKEPLTFSDGLHIPAGTFVCVVVAPQNQGDDDDQDKASFDGYRYYRKRLQNPDSTRNDYTATDADHLTFSHGRYACPGRHIASAEIKMALAHLLLKYDFKFPEGKGRPANLNLHELSFPDPAGRIMLKQRPGQADVL